MQAIDCLSCDVYRSIKTKGVISGVQIIINRFRHTYYTHTQLGQLFGDAESIFSTNRNECIDSEGS